jgi:hypothetical protein
MFSLRFPFQMPLFVPSGTSLKTRESNANCFRFLSLHLTLNRNWPNNPFRGYGSTLVLANRTPFVLFSRQNAPLVTSHVPCQGGGLVPAECHTYGSKIRSKNQAFGHPFKHRHPGPTRPQNPRPWRAARHGSKPPRCRHGTLCNPCRRPRGAVGGSWPPG